MRIERLGVVLDTVTALVDGAPHAAAEIDVRERGQQVTLTVTLAGDHALASIGLRLRARGVRQYLRNGYTSWDGSYFVDPVAARAVSTADQSITMGHAMTALLPAQGGGALVIGFIRHDRFQSRFRFALDGDDLLIDIETLLDGVTQTGAAQSKELVIFAGDDVEEALREWARMVAAASPLPPRLPARRLTGWCSWYNLYASLSEPLLLEHLGAARRFRDETRTPFDIFLIDDGFTPEMGDWLDFKPQFPHGIVPVLNVARDAGFIPGLWIAPFMVGNRSKLYAAHPDWVVRNRETSAPLAPMTFYGEFRWHKRSEEYYVLDITHPDAEGYIREVFRVWAKEWGVGYFKTDFMHLGSMYGPGEAVWHVAGLSRMEIWMRMARLIREEIGEALWLLCGSPIWAPVGLCDAVRIGRDIGVSWEGHYSAQSLLRDQTSRNFANGILWQADPDCILLRDRFHELSDDQVKSLATFAGLAGGVLMTSDGLDEVSAERRALMHDLAGDGSPFACEFPELGRSALTYALGAAPNGKPMAISHGDPVLLQRIRRPDGTVLINVFNTGDASVERVVEGQPVHLRPHQSVVLTVSV